MKAIKNKLVLYTYFGIIIDELFFSSIRQAMEEVQKRRSNIHYYCYAIYDSESGGIIKQGQ